MTLTTSKKKKSQLRYNEYYDIQLAYDDLYKRSEEGLNFYNLMNLICSESNVLRAYRNLKTNKGSLTSGVNKTNIHNIAKKNPKELVEYVAKRLNNYIPHKVKRVYIPKDNGKTRPLGIPSIEDRLIQQCIKQVLEPICEAKFYDYSFGFRPNRSTTHAIARVYHLMQQNELGYVVDVDIKSFFDNVNHGKLLKQMWTLGIRDKKLLKIISKMLKAEIEGEGIPDKGTPQGGILSPLLSNIVLNELDWWIHSQFLGMKTEHSYKNRISLIRKLKQTNLKEIAIVRYADDFKIFCRDYKSAIKIKIATEKWLKDRLELEVSEDKTKIINLRNNYSDFLGFKMKLVRKGYRPRSGKAKYVVKSNMSDKARNKAQLKVRNAIIELHRNPQKFRKEVNTYNSIVVGLHNYYKTATHISKDFHKIDYRTLKLRQKCFKPLYKDKGSVSKFILNNYDEKSIKYLRGIGIVPIANISCKSPKQFTQEICNYTQEGRQLIHDNLTGDYYKLLRYVMKNPVISRSVEYNDNRISLVAGQNGHCKITGKVLNPTNIHCHHVIPLSMKGNDKYKNLILIDKEIHKLIHLTDNNKILTLLKQLNLTENEMDKVNYYRNKAGKMQIA